MLLVKGRAVGVDWFEIAVSADNSVRRLPRVDARMAAAWTRGILPELLESPAFTLGICCITGYSVMVMRSDTEY